MKRHSNRCESRGFTVLEIVLVVVAAVMIAAVVSPFFVKPRITRSQSACIPNLRFIESAKQQWAVENKLTRGTPSNDSAITAYFKNSVLPQCPAGGAYTLGVVGTPPTCSIGKTVGWGHTI